jgi:hypothetical protein
MNRTDVRVYIAGPLTALPVGYIKNLNTMGKVYEDILRMGVAPYNPGSDIIQGLVAGDFELEDYTRVSMAWMKAAHVVFRMEGESKGADAEVQTAAELDIPIAHTFAELETIIRALTGEPVHV